MTLMALEDIKIILVAMVKVSMAKPLINYGQIRHLVLNTNTDIDVTVKIVARIIEKGESSSIPKLLRATIETCSIPCILKTNTRVYLRDRVQSTW